MDDFIQHALDQRPLDPATERDLGRRSRDGDQDARDTLITTGLRSVVLQAMMLGARGELLRDAVQAGTIAFITAVERFDPDRGVRLSTYAWDWVRGAVLAEVSRAGDQVVAEVQDVADDVEPGSAEHWLTGLDPLPADVLRLRYGLAPGTSPLSRRAVAEHLGLNESKVRRIEAEAMRHLRGRLARIVTRAPVRSAPVPYSSIGRAADC